jgi:hypothetical protein
MRLIGVLMPVAADDPISQRRMRVRADEVIE